MSLVSENSQQNVNMQCIVRQGDLKCDQKPFPERHLDVGQLWALRSVAGSAATLWERVTRTLWRCDSPGPAAAQPGARRGRSFLFTPAVRQGCPPHPSPHAPLTQRGQRTLS